MNASTIDAYVICLRRKPVTSQAMQVWKSVFPRLQVFEAIDGQTIDVETDSRIHVLTRMYLTGNNHVANDSIFSVPSRGAVGCFLSHTAIMQKCVDTGRPAIVIEQDAEFDATATSVLPDVVANIPPEADYVSLMYIKQPHVRSYNKYFNRLIGPECDGNQCYYIHPRGAKAILKVAFPIATQIDLLIGIVSHVHRNFAAFALKTRLYSMWNVLSDNMNSSIQNFAIKKYLPRTNMFYYGMIALLIALILYMLHTLS